MNSNMNLSNPKELHQFQYSIIELTDLKRFFRPYMKAVVITLLIVMCFTDFLTAQCKIDDWSLTGTPATYIAVGNSSNATTSTGAGINGGERDIEMTLSSPSMSNVGNSFEILGGLFVSSTTASATISNLIITYDGIDGNTVGVNTNIGLGDIDMSGSGLFSTTLNLDGMGVGVSTTVTFRVYSDATHWSDGSITFSGPATNPTYNIAIPKNTFVQGLGAVGPVDFASVNALQLILSTSQPGIDVTFSGGITVPCAVIPAVIPYVVNNVCGATYVDLTSLQITNSPPMGSTIVWSEHFPPLNSNDTITNFESIGIEENGLYYVYFRNSSTGIFSQGDSVKIELHACVCNGSYSTYSIDVPATIANNSIAVNGGTVNLVYTLTSGNAIPGVGSSYTIPVVYSDLSNTATGADNRWEGFANYIGQLILLPQTDSAIGGIYSMLPANNQQQELITATGGSDNFFATRISNGEVDNLGTFNLSFGNLPLLPSGATVIEDKLIVQSIGNLSTNGNGYHQGGFLLKPSIQTDVYDAAPVGATNEIQIALGQSYSYNYSAFGDGTNFPTNTGVRGAGIYGRLVVCLTEVCGNGIDDDGDGFIDENCTFSCDGTGYVVKGDFSKTILNSVNFANTTVDSLFTIADSIHINALGINKLDNYMYGLIYTRMSEGVLEPTNHLTRIYANGTYEDLGAVANLPVGTIVPQVSYNAGMIDSLGNYFVSAGSNEPNPTVKMYKIPLAAGAPYTATDSITLSEGGNYADFVYNTCNGKTYAFKYFDGLYEINTNSGAVTKIGSTIFPISLGALWLGNDCNVYGYGGQPNQPNQNTLFRMNIITGEPIALGTGTTVTFTDGASCPTAVLTLSGNILHDLDGLNDGFVDNNHGAEAAVTLPPGLTANLFDATTGVFVGTTMILADGSYMFPVSANTNYIVTISSVPATSLDSVLNFQAQLPVEWVHVGDVNDTDPIPTLITPGMSAVVEVGNTSQIEVNFGIQQPPIADSKTQSVPEPVSNSIPAGNVTNPISGIDPEEGILGSTDTIVITTLPSNAIMYYNGSVVTVGQVIVDFNPALLSYLNISNGSVDIIFQYAFIDSASQQGLSAEYKVEWLVPLPVALLSFTAHSENCNSALSWTTDHEENFSHFELERSFKNQVFIKVATISAQTGSGEKNYSYVDRNLPDGNYVYRLNCIDLDSHFNYTNSESLKINCLLEDLEIYPNPFVDEIFITLKAQESVDVVVSVYDVLGKIVISDVFEAKENLLQSVHYSTRHLCSGVYFVTIMKGEEQYIHKLLK